MKSSRTKTVLSVLLWCAGLALIVCGAFLVSHEVLDKPLSVDAAREGVRMRVMTEIDLTAAVSTDKVELNEDGMLQTRPSTGFCAT